MAFIKLKQNSGRLLLLAGMFLSFMMLNATPVFCATPVIVDAPAVLNSSYDLIWTLSATSNKRIAFSLLIETPVKEPGGYRLTLTSRQASWQSLSRPAAFPPVNSPISLVGGQDTTWTLKRRADTIALLCNHRLVFSAPAPSNVGGLLRLAPAVSGARVLDMHYQPIEAPRFGDDFMRSGGIERMLASLDCWQEDDCWQVASYQGVAFPGEKEALSTNGKTNPWQLSLFPNTQTTTNGFWLLYSGVGPSWVISHPLLTSPSWDRYYVQAAVKPEFESAVGLLAAYQDEDNYLLFRWHSQTQTAETRAELFAMIDGKMQTLATSSQGFSPAQWYQLRLNVGWRRVEALVDGKVLLAADNPASVEGRVGLYADAVASPQRPAMDAATTGMYVTLDPQTGAEINAASEALRTVSCIYFDDVRVGEWLRVTDLQHDGYLCQQTGRWKFASEEITAETPGRLLPQTPNLTRYSFSARVQLPEAGSAGLLINLTDKGSGYLWEISKQQHRLYPLTENGSLPAIAESLANIAPGTWVQMKVIVDGQATSHKPQATTAGTWVQMKVLVDGPYIACYADNVKVLEAYDETRSGGRCGLYAAVPGVRFADVCLTPTDDDPTPGMLIAHAGFAEDRWLATWASADADWVPAKLTDEAVIATASEHAIIGEAAPFPTDQPGIYWHKGGHYGDVVMTFPYSIATVGGQAVYLTDDEDINAGYTLSLTRAGYSTGVLTLLRKGEEVARASTELPENGQLIFSRRGQYLILRVAHIAPDSLPGLPYITAEQLLFAYHDQQPLPAFRIGVMVTNKYLAAHDIQINSTMRCETFEQSPVGWRTPSGVWAVMARYACAPQWNWFGGFGSGTPAAWSKTQLVGNQIVEAYLGVKMQYENMPEEYALRFRDLCLTICGDGVNTSSGYAVIRAGRDADGKVTSLLRLGKVVATTRNPAHLLPEQQRGHRQWFATRIEKHGQDISVYLDNRLALSYHDPEPLPSGQVAVWTKNNGIMLGRINLSAESFLLDGQ